MSLIYEIGQDIKLFVVSIKNGLPQSGQSFLYEVYDRSGVIQKSGTLAEVGATGRYEAVWVSPGITTTTNLKVLYIRDNKIKADEDIVVLDVLGTAGQSEIFDAISEADQFADGSVV